MAISAAESPTHGILCSARRSLPKHFLLLDIPSDMAISAAEFPAHGEAPCTCGIEAAQVWLSGSMAFIATYGVLCSIWCTLPHGTLGRIVLPHMLPPESSRIKRVPMQHCYEHSREARIAS
uniref:Uncharacterized protein n=1 Tax=Dunaliella tertiolecta TaxID=3047 RepID=A0A7S3R3I9_DUNTE